GRAIKSRFQDASQEMAGRWNLEMLDNSFTAISRDAPWDDFVMIIVFGVGDGVDDGCMAISGHGWVTLGRFRWAVTMGWAILGNIVQGLGGSGLVVDRGV
ncbi:unnamed protein product, partial [Calypogeia fissa]